MRTDSHSSVSHAEVRGGVLVRHRAERVDHGRAFAIASGLSSPRSWQLACDAVFAGLQQGVRAADQREIEGLPRALSICESARNSLFTFCDNLVERTLPDAALGATFFQAGELHVVSAGPMRAYLHRQGKPRRLTSREEVNEGLLRAPLGHATSSVEPDDLIMLGSPSAFSMNAIGRVVEVLKTDPRAEVAVLADILTEPAAQSGEGAAAIVIRVR